MMQKHFYLIHIQYLGFRFHGYAKQPQVKTIQGMIDKTIRFILGPEVPFKTLGSGRTDALVSANHMAFELFLQHPIDQEEFLELLNHNFPADIRALEIDEVDAEFNIIQNPKTKEYVYLFAHGQQHHPYSAPFIHTSKQHLDVELMKEGALLFEGKHHFRSYCKKPSETGKFEREVLVSRIEENTVLTANFFPEQTYAYHIHSKGFMRNQIRMMMGQLLRLGRGETDLEEIKKSLKPDYDTHLDAVAPASGLMLNKIRFD